MPELLWHLLAIVVILLLTLSAFLIAKLRKKRKSARVYPKYIVDNERFEKLRSNLEKRKSNSHVTESNAVQSAGGEAGKNSDDKYCDILEELCTNDKNSESKYCMLTKLPDNSVDSSSKDYIEDSPSKSSYSKQSSLVPEIAESDYQQEITDSGEELESDWEAISENDKSFTDQQGPERGVESINNHRKTSEDYLKHFEIKVKIDRVKNRVVECENKIDVYDKFGPSLRHLFFDYNEQLILFKMYLSAIDCGNDAALRLYKHNVFSYIEDCQMKLKLKNT